MARWTRLAFVLAWGVWLAGPSASARAADWVDDDARHAADLATRAAADPAALAHRLGHANPLVRYWACRGLALVGERGAPHAAAVRARLDDANPSVRVAAARALWRMGEVEGAVGALRRELAGDVPFARLEAISVVNEMGPAGRPLVSAASQAAEAPPFDYVKRLAGHIERRFAPGPDAP